VGEYLVEKYKYRAMNDLGKPVRGVLTAANEQDLFAQLQDAGLELISCSNGSKKAGFLSALGKKKIPIRELMQFFMNLRQMQAAGIPLLDSLADLRDTSDNDSFRDVISEIYRELSEGSSFSEAMGSHPRVFSNLHISLISSGEQNGDIQAACQQLVKYLKWVDSMQSMVRKATRYPMFLLFAVILTVVVMMAFVVPQIVGFISELDQELPFATRSLMATSDFFVAHWLTVIIGLVSTVVTCIVLFRTSDGFAYQFDSLMLRMPVMGDLIRKINIARFSQTFGALFKGGIDVLKALDAASNTVTNRVLKQGLDDVQEYVKSGDSLSVAMNRSGEFPSMVVRMLRVGEESGNLTEVLDQVAEFYTNDVDEEVQKVISMIEPSLTAILGGMILWIAVGVFGPIYSSFENLDI
jgi:type IV pilus assembly protein PilC